MMIFDFFKIRFLAFYKAEWKSEDIFVLRRVRAFHRYPFCRHRAYSYDVLSPLPIVLSKHFNHPHPYIEIATAISDIPSECIELSSVGLRSGSPQLVFIGNYGSTSYIGMTRKNGGQ